MSAELSDLQQRLVNMLRVGKVHSIDYTAARLRVAFGNGNISAPVPWLTGRAGSVREWNPPAVGEQVVLCNPSGTGNAGFALPGGIYQTANPANGSEGGHVELDLPAAGKWRITIGAFTIEATQASCKITVGASSFEVTDGKVTILSDVDVTGNIAVTGGITTTEDVVAGTVSLQTHVHGGVQSGGANTAVPNP